MPSTTRTFFRLILTAVMLLAAAPLRAQDGGTIAGTVVDPLGARVSGATVKLLLGEQAIKEVSSNADGAFTFDALSAGRYRIQASSTGFQTRTSDPMFVSGTGHVSIELARQATRVPSLGDQRPAACRGAHGVLGHALKP